MKQKFLDRFWDKVLFTTNCWEWIGTKNELGYGKICLNYKQMRAHRISYELYKGKIPNGLDVDHICNNPSCVNPDHLQAITHKENMLRGKNPFAANSKKTHCIRGHELSGNNVYQRKDRAGTRECKKCRCMTYKKWKNTHGSM